MRLVYHSHITQDVGTLKTRFNTKIEIFEKIWQKEIGQMCLHNHFFFFCALGKFDICCCPMCDNQGINGVFWKWFVIIKVDNFINKRHMGVEICSKCVGIDDKCGAWIENSCRIKGIERDYVVSELITTMKGDTANIPQYMSLIFMRL